MLSKYHSILKNYPSHKDNTLEFKLYTYISDGLIPILWRQYSKIGNSFEPFPNPIASLINQFEMEINVEENKIKAVLLVLHHLKLPFGVHQMFGKILGLPASKIPLTRINLLL